MAPHEGLGWPKIDSLSIESLPPVMRELAIELLLHKSLFVGKWLEDVSGEDEATRDVLATIRRETISQAEQAIGAMHRWNEHPGSQEAAAEAARHTRRRLFENLVGLKEGSTEVFLGAGMQAPTNELRQDFIRLADLDREHADELRMLMGTQKARRRNDPTGMAPLGAHVGRDEATSLRADVERKIARLADLETPPRRIVVSPEALRHLRDEGAVDMERGTICGLSGDVDFGWIGDTYALVTPERVTLAEIFTKLNTPDHPQHHEPQHDATRSHADDS